MPKQKTHKMTAKKLNVRPGGTVTRGTGTGRHNTGKKSAAASRKYRKPSLLSKGDRNRLKNLI
jgi:ribosomal protein L35